MADEPSGFDGTIYDGEGVETAVTSVEPFDSRDANTLDRSNDLVILCPILEGY